MKIKAINLKVGQVVKFTNSLGTHTMKLTNVGRADKNQLMFKGTMISTRFKSFKTNAVSFDEYNVGATNFFFARFKTQFQVL